jgi:hypothetical protein
MFCGGVFVSKLSSNDLFVCSDGIEMDQKELLIIVRAVLNSLQGQPPKDSYPVLYLQAASIRIRFHRGCLFGVCTYQPMSGPLLASLMDRITSAADSSFRATPELDLSNSQYRATFLLAIRALISESPSATISREVRQSFNIPRDMAMNVGGSHLIDPVASGDFTIVAKAKEASGDEASAHESTTETSTPVDTYTSEPSVANDKVFTQFLAVRIEQEVRFEVRERKVENVWCSTDLWLSAYGELTGKLQFALNARAAIEQPRLNRNVLESVKEDVYAVIDSNTISDDTKVLIFEVAGIESEQLPFEVHCTFATTDGHAEFTIAVGGQFPMAEVLVGLSAADLEDPVCRDEPVVIAGSTACLRTDFIEAGEQEVWVVQATVPQWYEPPQIIRVKCKLRGPHFGGIELTPEPLGAFGIERIVRDLDVQQSVWPFTP